MTLHPELKNLRAEYLLRLGDNALILSQRLCEWCGHAPTLEEDLALSNVALDLLGQARLWLDAAGRGLTPAQSEDDLAYGRDAQAFRNVLLVELTRGNFADTQMRQFLFDSWHCLLLRELSDSADAEVAAIASKALKEATYHLRRSSGWVVRLGDGSRQSREFCLLALERCWHYVGELFEMDELEQAMLAQGVGCDLAALYPEWLAYVNEVLAAATLEPPHAAPAVSGGKRGAHGEALVALLMEMQFLSRAHPGAGW
ncbi:ring-1,2-phenylacetyl-CoA epoxidase subunit PaaC [Chromobacterium alkanivorans]|uniref:1,2-phenylacetyl-CoA epoxidase subunit PaaC n=1 Tax=Chromobacterium alkanivorans TaxID=1071719 RepID=UPI002169DF85|nr:ring-1,2-phenylacetyl-CoA epoxidase subunit PaaC [Chromobacterium alkanivorans]MCS3820048.1 ring-1,2-phenylacetyl-CoA epoxidase subunit PaaC [Chromobacterium alkanivorans]MCS3874805.1 ring-1,2-phenylacetyl-CoA epoxidase subunit PaaC [Chromobacterium alkanivorans]